MRRLSICLLLLSAFSCLLFAQASTWSLNSVEARDKVLEQHRTISNYCRLDYQGARLSPQGWEKMRDLALSRENQDFHVVFIVARYQVVENPEPAYDVTVNYSLIGKYEEGLGYTPMSGIQAVNFETADKGGAMRIKAIDPNSPFAGRNAAVEWLKTKLAATNSTTERNRIQSAIHALQPEPKPPESKPQAAAKP